MNRVRAAKGWTMRRLGQWALAMSVVAGCSSSQTTSGTGGASGAGASGGSEPRAGSANGGRTGQGGSSTVLGGSSGNAGSAAQSGGGSGGTSGAGTVAGSAGQSAGQGGVAGSTAGGTSGGGTSSGGTSGGGTSGGGTSGGGTSSGGTGGGGAACTTPVMPTGPGCDVYGTVLLEYLVGTSTSQLSFTVRLRAGFMGPVPLNQIEVQYYLSLEEDSGFQATVDSFVQHGPDADHTATSQISVVKLEPAQKSSVVFDACQTHFIRIRNTSSAELAASTDNNDSYVEFHVTLTPNNAAAPNQVHTNDQSYQPSSTAFQTNTAMGVFVCGQLVDGCTPGDGGPCN